MTRPASGDPDRAESADGSDPAPSTGPPALSRWQTDLAEIAAKFARPTARPGTASARTTEPNAAVEPAENIEPTRPSEPAAPVEPIQPAGSVEPVHPPDPGGGWHRPARPAAQPVIAMVPRPVDEPAAPPDRRPATAPTPGRAPRPTARRLTRSLTKPPADPPAYPAAYPAAASMPEHATASIAAPDPRPAPGPAPRSVVDPAPPWPTVPDVPDVPDVPNAEPVGRPASDLGGDVAARPAPPHEDSPASTVSAGRAAPPRRTTRARSTTRLLSLLAVVALGGIALGGFLGRVTAPEDPPPAPPPLVAGEVESVTHTSEGSQLTVLTGRGHLVVYVATSAAVATRLPGGLDALHTGDHVVVDSHLDPAGSLTATTVLAGGGP